jgi:SAM-dependent methyltransferase/uncharacterized protein YbaR (Trm112 family)
MNRSLDVASGLVCPRDREPLAVADDRLSCAQGHSYPVVDGIPVLLDPDVDSNHPEYWATIGEILPSKELDQPTGGEIDQYVRWAVRGTCGNLYDGDRITKYPIPTLPLAGPGRFLDVGANWGRWSIAAARAGFDVAAVDPGLGGMRAARRVARQVGMPIEVVVGDVRHLPYPDSSVDVVFSYSVLQHFGPDDLDQALRECARVLRPGGVSLHQLTNAYGLLNAGRQGARRFRAARGFEVRYWRPRALEELFTRLIGPTTLSADGFLTLNPHAADLTDLNRLARVVVRTSRALTQLSTIAPPLVGMADSLWVRSIRFEDRIQ